MTDNEILPGAPVTLAPSSEQIIAPELGTLDPLKEIKTEKKSKKKATAKKIEPEVPTLAEEVQAPANTVAVVEAVKEEPKNEVAVVETTTAVAHPKNRVFYKVTKGSDITDAEFAKIQELISKTGTVKADGLRDRIRRCEVFVLAKEDGKTVGCMALRSNKSGYMKKMISRSGVSGLGQNALELAWMRLLPSRKSIGIEEEMFARIVLSVKNVENKNLYGRKVFSIWPVEDDYSQRLMSIFGFTKHTKDHSSVIDSSKRVQLYLY